MRRSVFQMTTYQLHKKKKQYKKPAPLWMCWSTLPQFASPLKPVSGISYVVVPAPEQLFVKSVYRHGIYKWRQIALPRA